MFCTNCGKEIADEAYICPHCGVLTNNGSSVKFDAQDNASPWWGVLSFIYPLIGLILFLVWQKERPKSAKICGKGALAGFIIQNGFYFLFILYMFIILLIYSQFNLSGANFVPEPVYL